VVMAVVVIAAVTLGWWSVAGGVGVMGLQKWWLCKERGAVA